MDASTKKCYEKRGQILVKNLQSRRFEAYYCADKASALKKALELIPRDAIVGWGGCASAQQIGLMDAVKAGYKVYDRDSTSTMEERVKMMKKCLTADVFLTGANAISLDGQMVNIDGNGNRVAAIVYGPDSIIVIAGMNKVVDTLEDAVKRARTIASPINQQKFADHKTPCMVTGSCGNCKEPDCICNQILITRHCRPQGRIKFVIVGEELGY